MAKENERNPYGDKHPFEKVYDQIDELLKIIQEHRHKTPGTVPEWIYNELVQVEKEFQRFQKVTSQTIPAPQFDEKQFRKLMRQLPEDQRPIENDLVERGRILREQVLEMRRDHFLAYEKQKEKDPKEEKKDDNSPLNLLKEKDKEKEDKDKKLDDKELKANLDHKKKYGRIGGRKNWRPM